MKPWTPTTLTPADLTWEAFCEYIKFLEDNPTLVHRCRLRIIHNITHGLSVDAKTKRVLRAKRMLVADVVTPAGLRKLRSAERQDDHDSAGDGDEAERRRAEVALTRLHEQHDPFSDKRSKEEALISASIFEAVKRLSAVLDCASSKVANAMTAAPSGDEATCTLAPPTGRALPVSAGSGMTSGVQRAGSGSSDRGGAQQIVVGPSSKCGKAPSVQTAISKLNQPSPVTTLKEFVRLVTESRTPRMEPSINVQPRISPLNHSGAPTAPIQLSSEQQAVMDVCHTWYKEFDDYKTGCCPNRPQQQLLLIHGAPGTGKSACVERLIDFVSSRGEAIVVSSLSSSAANLIRGGRTNHSLYFLPIQVTNKYPAPLQYHQLAQLTEWVGDSNWILFDEASMMSPIDLACISARWQQLKRNTLPFGGVNVIMLADFYQLPPVGGIPFFRALIRRDVDSVRYDAALAAHTGTAPKKRVGTAQGKSARPVIDADDGELPELHECYETGSPGFDGVALFRGFKKIDFTTQHRSVDPAHTHIINKLRDPSLRFPIDDEVIKYFEDRVITEEAVKARPELAFAVVLVLTNREKAHHALARALQYAAEHNEAVLGFPLPMRKSAYVDTLSAAEKQYIYENKVETIALFVRGAPACLTEPVAPRRHIPNSLMCTMHSVTFPADMSADELERCMHAIDSAPRGKFTLIGATPLCINVEADIPVSLFGQEASIVEGKTVFPVPLCKYRKANKVAILGDLVVNGGVLSVERFAVELAFSSTVNRIQGRNEQYLTMDATLRPYRFIVLFAHLYVAVSRLKYGKDLFFLPPPPDGNFDHLRKLRPPFPLSIWMQCYDSSGQYDPIRARQLILESDPKYSLLLSVATGVPVPLVGPLSGAIHQPGSAKAARSRKRKITALAITDVATSIDGTPATVVPSKAVACASAQASDAATNTLSCNGDNVDVQHQVHDLATAAQADTVTEAVATTNASHAAVGSPSAPTSRLVTETVTCSASMHQSQPTSAHAECSCCASGTLLAAACDDGNGGSSASPGTAPAVASASDPPASASSTSVSSWSSLNHPYRLTNFGNTCYVNSCIQVRIHVIVSVTVAASSKLYGEAMMFLMCVSLQAIIHVPIINAFLRRAGAWSAVHDAARALRDAMGITPEFVVNGDGIVLSTLSKLTQLAYLDAPSAAERGVSMSVDRSDPLRQFVNAVARRCSAADYSISSEQQDARLYMEELINALLSDSTTSGTGGRVECPLLFAQRMTERDIFAENVFFQSAQQQHYRVDDSPVRRMLEIWLQHNIIMQSRCEMMRVRWEPKIVLPLRLPSVAETTLEACIKLTCYSGEQIEHDCPDCLVRAHCD